jgi:C-terminal processing protease CtpA/Prc
MVAKRSLRDALREARSVVWSFHSSDERQSRAPAKALPIRVSRHWRSGFVARLANDQRHSTRPAPRRCGQWTQKRDSRILLRPLLIMLAATTLTLSGCSVSGGDGGGGPQVGTPACLIDGQKQFVHDVMRDIYFWYDLLPANVDLSQYASPEELLDFLISFQPLDNFSYISSAEADAQFFGEGQFEGFGFSTRFETADDLRFTRVFSGSPAAQAGFQRGQRILELGGRTIAEIQANEGLAVVFGQSPLEFRIRNLDNSEFIVTVSHDIVTINPLPQWRVIDMGGVPVGYVEFATFVSTAEPVFNTVFSDFNAAGVTDVIIDMRYNGGGLVDTARLLGDYLGGSVAGRIFSLTVFNDKNSFRNETELFEQIANSMNLSRLVVIATSGTASASELVINSMEPHTDVTIVGDTTFGKPVGQVGALFCDKILRATAFETLNALNEGGYFNGLPVDCPAADDLAEVVGSATDPNLVTALTYLETGACPAAPAMLKAEFDHKLPQIELRGSAWREFAGAF